jgi:hypothetical protein
MKLSHTFRDLQLRPKSYATAGCLRLLRNLGHALQRIRSPPPEPLGIPSMITSTLNLGKREKVQGNEAGRRIWIDALCLYLDRHRTKCRRNLRLSPLFSEGIRFALIGSIPLCPPCQDDMRASRNLGFIIQKHSESYNFFPSSNPVSNIRRESRRLVNLCIFQSHATITNPMSTHDSFLVQPQLAQDHTRLLLQRTSTFQKLKYMNTNIQLG